MQNAALQLHTIEPERRAPRLWRTLLPLALYAALALALADVFGTPPDVPALLLGAAVAAALALAPARTARAAGIAAVLGAALSLALPPVRAGALLLANRLYASSEAVNAYAYRYYAVAEDAFALRAALLTAAVLGGALCALFYRRRLALVTMLLMVSFLEAYFGVAPEAWRNLLLFAVLALLLLQDDALTPNGAALLALLAAVALTAFLLAPRPNAAVEAYSEHLRDELSAAASNALRAAAQPEPETEPVHQESRQHAEQADPNEAGEQGRQTFERQAESEQELSLPHRVDYGRIALLLLAVIALLLVPFLPFLLLNRAKRLAAQRRAAFEDADNAAAIRAMFAHTMRWLRAAGLQTENRPFAQCREAVERITSNEYAARYAEGVAVWQEAAYSGHAMSKQQRAAVRALLEKTEATLYEKADRRTRLRFKYVDCLCEV